MQNTLPRSLPLLLRPQQLRRPKPTDKIQERFEKFHAENPHVYKMLVDMARQVKAAGKEHYAIDTLFARLRWHYDIETQGDGFLLNNSYRSRYARLIMDSEPDLKGFFHTRLLVSTCRKPQPQRAAA